MLDSKDDLVYDIKDQKIKISSFYTPISNLFSPKYVEKYKDLTYKINNIKGIITINSRSSKEINFDIFLKGIEYKILNKNKEGIFYSSKHMESIMTKYNITEPILMKIVNKEVIKQEEIMFVDDTIIILERKNVIDFNYIYDKMSKIYEKKDVSYLIAQTINLEKLSPNYDKYFFNENYNKNKLEEVPIFMSNLRIFISTKIFNFLNTKEKIFAICGPYGIGKTFTALLIQKELFKEGKNTLYINLDNNQAIEELKINLIKEFFFLNLEKNIFINLSTQIYEEIYNDIWELITKIDNFCNENNIKYLLFLDQYQKNKDKNNILSNIKTNKIFLLSTINDEDIKDNLFSEKQKDILFSYIYISNFKFDKSIELLIKNKSDENKKCIEMFNYLPFSIFSMENYFNRNILDFLNSQFWIVLKQLHDFYQFHKTDHMCKLKDNKFTNNFDDVNTISIDKKDFINNIKDICLKFISFEINSDFMRLFYTFKYINDIFEFEINYLLSKESFLKNFERSKHEGEFEKLIEHKFILEKNKFNIDGFIKVNKIVNMKLENEHRLISNIEITQKNCIFISQLISEGDDYNFAILYPKKEEIVLIQSKYKLTNKNVHDIEYYTSKIGIIKEALGNLDINVNKIYILYISSVEYNSKYVFKILNNKHINCLFFNVKQNYFTSDFKNNIIDFKSLSAEIYPKVSNYISQQYESKKIFDQLLIPIINKLQNERKKTKIQDLEEEYNNFISYLLQKNTDVDLISQLGKFYCKINSPIEFPKLTFDYYLLFFKLNSKENIDYNKDLIIVYEIEYNLFYYNVQNRDESKWDLYKLLESYDLIIGFWNDLTINYDEDQ